MDDERTPLLSTPGPSTNATAQLSIPAFFASLAALRSGKLPSSSQLQSILSALLASQVLQPNTTIFQPTYGSGRLGVGALSNEGEKVRIAVRHVLEALVAIGGKEVVRDNGVQELLWACKTAQLEYKLPTADLPSQAGLLQFRYSLQTLFTVFFTSPQLRALISDFINLATTSLQATVTESMGENVGVVFNQLSKEFVDDVGLGKVEEVPVDEKAKAEKPVPPEVPLPPPSPDELRDDFIDRFKVILTQIQETPSYRSSIKTLLHVVRAYSTQLSTSLEPAASFASPSPASQEPIRLLLPLLASFSGGSQSLDPLLSSLSALMEHLKAPSERLKILLHRLDAFLDAGLLQPHFLKSAAADRKLGEIHDAFVALASLPEGQNPLPEVAKQLGEMMTRIAQDKELVLLGNATGELGEAVQGWGFKAAQVATGQQGLWGDLIEWVLPRVLSMLGEVPLPRIEFTSPVFDAAVDAPPFVATSLVPDRITLESHSTVNLYLSEPPPAPPASRFLPSFLAPPINSVQAGTAATTSTLTIKGLRFQALNLGYFARYHPGWLCFPLVEAGLLDILVGSPAGHGGLDLVVNFEIDSAAPTPAPRTLLHLVGATPAEATLASFSLMPHSSSHPLILWLLRPIMRTVVRTQLESLISQKVESLLEWLGRVGWEVRRRARDEGGGGWGWSLGVVETLMEGVEETNEEKKEREDDASAGVEEAEEEALADGADDEESALHVSSKGVTYDLAPPAAETGEAEVVVGVGKEGIVLPVGEASTPVARLTATEIVKNAAEDVVKDGKKAAKALVEGVEVVLGGVGEFQETVKVERKEEGWQSDVFDFS